MGNMSEDIFESGLKEGKKKGRDESRRSIASRMLAAGKLTLEEIAEYVDLPLAEVNALAKQLRGA